MKRTVKNRLKEYALGLDRWGLLLFAVIMLPNIVAMCVPAFSSRFAENSALDVAAVVFQVFAVAALLFIVRREEERLRLSPLVTAALLALIAYLIAWGFFFFGYLSSAVWLLLAVMPCIALLCFEIERKNVFALPFTVVFAVLHIISACITYL